MATKLYSKRDIESHLELNAVLEVMKKTYVETAQGRVLNPSKLTMHLGDDGGWPDRNAFSIDMPAYVDWLEVAGMKWAVATWDADTDQPISSQILLFDLDRGEFTSIMEGMYITGVRTAMQSVIGLKQLRRESPASVGVYGAGFQAKFQIPTIDRLTDVETFRLFDTDTEAANSLASALETETDADIVVEESPSAVVESDAIITVTNSKSPVLKEAWLDGDEFIIALGSYRELPEETILDSDHIFVDHPEQCLERGALAGLAERDELTATDLSATIGEVLDGGYERAIDPDDRVVFVPIGLGSQDIAIAEHLHRYGEGNSSVETFEFA
ncbi:ornithine cyclodeaminase family protein [Haloarcula amylovorans]|uniref:ornithine cyclodeaminase family protein n=1 Tax=Haloarcula amylovorans TaxID=2562280 RepID=UPI001075E705|nr:ornithine cyclodeaminase family protein [Halomicroarcula amylolytica]